MSSTISATTSTSSGPSACAYATAPPEATQAGIDCNCNKWVQQRDGAFCYDMAAAAGIPLGLLYLLNPALNRDCNGLFVGYAYCIGLGSAAGTSTTSSTAPASTCVGGTNAPEQTQVGISCKCNSWVKQTDGVFCFDMAAAAGIELSNLYSLNPALNGDCSGLFVGYACCVGVAQ